jgi:hypothetical protein
LNTHERSSLPSPPAYPGFSNGQFRCSVDGTIDSIVLDTPSVLFLGAINKCTAAFPHLAALILTSPVQLLNNCIDDSTFSFTDILASIALETFDNVGPTSGAFSVCEAGYAIEPFDAFSGTVTASSRTIFSFP